MANVITDILRYRHECSVALCLLSQSKDAVAAYRTTTYMCVHAHTQSVILSVFKVPEIFQREHLHSPHMAPKTLTLSPVVPLP